MGSERRDVIIIGAGPAGLAVAGRLRKEKTPFIILEQSNFIANSWRQHYDRLCLHTVRDLSNLPHLAFPSDYPQYVPRDFLIAYYENYAQEFQIEPKFNAKVKKVERVHDGWKVRTADDKTFVSDQVVVATGTNRIPYEPEFRDQDVFAGEVIHSRSYKNPKHYLDKKVLVIGMGNTGAEISLDLANHGVQTYISVRGPINVIPRDLNGRPVQTTAKLLDKLPFGLGNWIGAKIRDVYFGDLSPYGLQRSKLAPIDQLMQTGKTPVIDIGTIDMIKKGKIKVIPGIDRFEKNAVVYNGSQHIDLDAVILATGYRSKLEDFIPGVEGFLDQFSYPKSPIGTGDLEGLYFIGFDNYKLGGLLGTIREDSLIIAEAIV